MQPRILVADDQADILSALKLLLKREGFEVATASSPAGVQDIVAREFSWDQVARRVEQVYARVAIPA